MTSSEPGEVPAAIYAPPPIVQTRDGSPRRLGLELEMSGVGIGDLANAIVESFGGHVTDATAFERRVAETSLGDFKVELDSRPLKQRVHAEFLQSLGIDTEHASLMPWIDESLGAMAQTVVPCELVSPPIAIDRLAEIEPLWPRLRALGVEGTRSSMLYAFGLHLNPELPDCEASTILAHLQAFLLLYDWLADEEHIDLSRRLTPFIFPFREDYRRRILAADYAPDLDTLIRDYLADSPTRNRPLDMLPLFAALRPDLVAEGVSSTTNVSARPTFHYRLPNCEIDQPGWTPATAWNRWLEVERLAVDHDRRASMALAYLRISDLPFRAQASQWVRETRDAWLDERAA